MNELNKYSDEEIININKDIEKELKSRGYEYDWHKKDKHVGAIYILFNSAFPDLVKIGYADDVQKRMTDFNHSSALPDHYHCYAVYKVKKRLGDKKLHSLIDTLNPSLRYQKNREFYKMKCEKAFEILYAIAQINGDEDQLIKNPFQDPFYDSLPTTEVIKSDNDKPKKQRLTFSLLRIPVGSTLVFVKDRKSSCTTLDDVNRVEYNGKPYTLSALAAKLLDYGPVQGGKYFMYNGELLTDIREKLGV